MLLALGTLVAWRRSSSRQLRKVQDSASRTEAFVVELSQTLDAVRAESDTARDVGERAEREAGRLRAVGEVASLLDLDAVAERALEEAAGATGGDAAMLVLAATEEDAEPYRATFGLSEAESARDLAALPADVSDARAVTIRYRYTPDERENDVFRLTHGLAVPVDTRDGRIGTLAVFWRRVEREPGEALVAELEALASAFAAPLEGARQLEEARELADVDLVTGLQNARYFTDRLGREVARARRYERRLALLLFHVPVGEAPGGLGLLGPVGRRVRSAIRSADVACHLGDGRFAVILPEVGLPESEHLRGRLQFALGQRLGMPEQTHLAAGRVELRPDDSADSLVRRAEEELEAAEQPEPVRSTGA